MLVNYLQITFRHIGILDYIQAPENICMLFVVLPYIHISFIKMPPVVCYCSLSDILITKEHVATQGQCLFRPVQLQQTGIWEVPTDLALALQTCQYTAGGEHVFSLYIESSCMLSGQSLLLLKSMMREHFTFRLSLSPAFVSHS